MVGIAGRAERERRGIVRCEAAYAIGRSVTDLHNSSPSRGGLWRRWRREMGWKTHRNLCAVCMSRWSDGGWDRDAMSLSLRLHKVGAIGRSRERKAREFLLCRNEIDVRHNAYRETEKLVDTRNRAVHNRTRRQKSKQSNCGLSCSFVDFVKLARFLVRLVSGSLGKHWCF